MTSGEQRPEWAVQAPVGGWGPPWPQAAEIAGVIPAEQWTLIGGWMVQLHAVRAGVPLNRATVDVDMIVHIETGAATFGGVRARLEEGREVFAVPAGTSALRKTVDCLIEIDSMSIKLSVPD